MRLKIFETILISKNMSLFGSPLTGQGISSPSIPDMMYGDINSKSPPIPSNYPPKSLTPNSTQPSFKKSKWTSEEDRQLIKSVTKNGMTNWSLVAKEVPGRTGKQCRERWANQLCPDLTKEDWTPQEDDILKKQQAIYGNLWAKIARFLPGRSANSVKNRWSWLTRHRPPMQFSSPMVPFFAQQHFNQMQYAAYQNQRLRQTPPIPQIHQIQQTCPADAQIFAGSASESLQMAASEPTVFPPPAESFGSMNDLDVICPDQESHDILDFPQLYGETAFSTEPTEFIDSSLPDSSYFW